MAAVLVVLYPHDGATFFPLTVRLDTLTHHPGQVSLPGGRLEDVDSSLWEAALREAREEVALRTGRILPLGRLDTVPTVVSKHLIVPFVGWSPVRPRLRPNPEEVAEVIEVPLSAVTDRSTVREEVWHIRGRTVAVTYYDLAGYAVWGATARVLSDLATRLEPGLDLGPYPPGWVRPT
jgi:8-oxo-dGTP pyrophosphatase MutT (NUDIX family)